MEEISKRNVDFEYCRGVFQSKALAGGKRQ